MKGLYVVIEGVDGTGKSTQAEMLNRALQYCGYPVKYVQEPGGESQFGQTLRALFKNHMAELTPETQMYLIMAAKRELMAREIAPALEKGQVIIADRGLASLYGYQHGRFGLPVGEIDEMLTQASWLITPSVSFHLTLPVNETLARIAARSDGSDDWDPATVMEVESIAGGYETTRTRPEIWGDRHQTVDCENLSRGAIHARILRTVLNVLSE